MIQQTSIKRWIEESDKPKLNSKGKKFKVKLKACYKKDYLGVRV
jgi:hypothetical protein